MENTTVTPDISQSLTPFSPVPTSLLEAVSTIFKLRWCQSPYHLKQNWNQQDFFFHVECIMQAEFTHYINCKMVYSLA